MKKNVLLGFVIFIVISAVMVLRPVPIVYEKEAISEVGIIKNFYEGGVHDLVIILENNSRRFYINRGLENGLNIDSLKANFLGKEAIIKYPKYWTPLDWNNTVKHISKLQFGDTIVFDEFKKK